MHKLDKFEDIIAEQLNKQEYAYDASAWSKIEKQLPPPNKAFPIKWIIAATIILSAGVATFFFNNSKETTNTSFVQVEKDLKANTTNDSFTSQDPKEQFVEPTNELSHDIKEEIIKTNTVEINNETIIKEPTIVNDNRPLLEVVNETPTSSDKIENHPPVSDHVVTPVLKTPSAKFVVSNTRICLGETIELTALNELVAADYLWNFGDANYSKQKTVHHKFDHSGTFYISLEARNSANNDILAISDKVAITVLEIPKSKFTTENVSKNHIPHIQFINLSEGATSFDWRFSSGGGSTKKDPILATKNKGHFSATLISKNANGCSSTVSTNFEIENDFNLLAPNAFTPNGDGINDNFLPVSLTQMNVDFEMNIYDKRGLIYTTRNIDQPWDGINQREGGKSTSNNYIWTVTYTDDKNVTQTYKGTVLLLD